MKSPYNASMSVFKTGILISSLGLILLHGLSAAENSEENLVKNGNFEKGLDGWSKRNGISIATDAGNSWLVADGGDTSTFQEVPIKPEYYTLKMTTRMRVTDVEQGDQSWKTARLAMSFHDKDGKRVGAWPDVIHALGTSDWVNYEKEYEVPAGAESLHLNPGNLGKSGKVEFDDIKFIVTRTRATSPVDAKLPAGVENPWDMADAWQAKSSSRESVCLNGLWGFFPVLDEGLDKKIPALGQGWGWFKVPGSWPGMTSWDIGGGSQEVIYSPWLVGKVGSGGFDQAWYRREISIPADWGSWRISLEFTMLATHAKVFIDGKEAGEIWWPGGKFDITKFVKPGSKHELVLLVTAVPLEKESQSFSAPDRVTKSKAVVNLKGITGDMFLVGEPETDAISDVHLICSTRKNTITFDTGIDHPAAEKYSVSAKILENGKVVKTFSADELGVAELKNGRISVTGSWDNAKLWDMDATGNMYDAVVTLHDGQGKVLDESLPIKFGFREFWIDGPDFYLNGRKLHLRGLHNMNSNRHAEQSCEEMCRMTCRKMLEYGFNFLISGNYDFQPGAVGYVDGLLNAADKEGVMVGFSMPHIKDFNFKLDDPVQVERYRKLAYWIVRRVQNHPSVIAYSLNHNSTGYYGDQNPLKIDGIYSPDKAGGKINYKDGNRNKNRTQAAISVAIVRSIDPTRAIYHHQSGNLDDMHTVNIYLNWAPRQERDDWLEHWSEKGQKPLFFVEWGLPHISSFSSFRGPAFIWRNPAFQSIWDSEFSAPLLGENAYEMTPLKVKSLEHEEKLWAKGEPFYWSQLIGHFRNGEKNYMEVLAWFGDTNWRSHRTWGISAMLPWDQGNFWSRVKETRTKENNAKFANLKVPGIVPDRFGPSGQYIYDPGQDTFEPSSIGKMFLRWNMPFCAYIGGGARFTSKAHNYLPGESVKKQLVILNDSRRDQTCNYSWDLNAGSFGGKGTVDVKAGGKALVPIEITLPAGLKPGKYSFSAKFDFGNSKQEDSFDIHVLAPVPKPEVKSNIALFDPVGKTTKMLDQMGVKYKKVETDSSLDGISLLVIGREAISGETPLPDMSRVKDGMNVLVFEQTADALQNRLGFRINVHGMRRAFIRSAHPVLAGLGEENLRNWRGAATLTPPYLQGLPEIEEANPKWFWCSNENTRVWRCGNYGNVASVLIEKPPVGNWLPIVDCGFDLQYSPLLEYREGKGKVIFCQLDVTGREGENDPAPAILCSQLISYLDPLASEIPARQVFYAGGKEGSELLEKLGIAFKPLAGEKPGAGDLVVVASGAQNISNLTGSVESGANLLALGLNSNELNQILPGKIKTIEDTPVSQMIKDLSLPEFRGISNSELHWRTRPKITALADPSANSNNALKAMTIGKGQVVLCQAAPWMFDYAKKAYLRVTYRRNVFLVSRLMANLGAQASCPLVKKISGKPVMSNYSLTDKWVGLVDREGKGRENGWFKPDFDDSTWKPIKVPGAFDSDRPELKDYDGLFWYRIHFSLPNGLDMANLQLALGAVDDESWVWLNGRFLGEVTKKTNPKDYWVFPRIYDIRPEWLNPDGDNVLAVLVNDTYLSGGIMGRPYFGGPGAWEKSYYVQQPVADDDPYRYYRW